MKGAGIKIEGVAISKRAVVVLSLMSRASNVWSRWECLLDEKNPGRGCLRVVD